MAVDDDDLLDCFLHLPQQEGIPFMLDYKTIVANQQLDTALQEHLKKSPKLVFKQLLAPDLEVICYSPKEGSPWKIYLPQQLLRSTI